jgi:hypothetical protein
MASPGRPNFQGHTASADSRHDMVSFRNEQTAKSRGRTEERTSEISAFELLKRNPEGQTCFLDVENRLGATGPSATGQPGPVMGYLLRDTFD